MIPPTPEEIAICRRLPPHEWQVGDWFWTDDGHGHNEYHMMITWLKDGVDEFDVYMTKFGCVYNPGSRTIPNRKILEEAEGENGE